MISERKHRVRRPKVVIYFFRVSAIRTETMSVTVLDVCIGITTNKLQELQDEGGKTNQVNNVCF